MRESGSAAERSSPPRADLIALAILTALITLLFIDGTAPRPCEGPLTGGGNLPLLDANADASVDLTDAVHLLAYLFLGGPAHDLGPGCEPVADCPDACGG